MSEVGGPTYPQSVIPGEDVAAQEKRFHKAYWWRTVNRILSVFGLLIIGAVVSSLCAVPYDTRHCLKELQC
jgi:hypothetical protein